MKRWLTRAVCLACLLGLGTSNLFSKPEGRTADILTISPSSIDFGPQTVDQSGDAKPVLVSNTGQQAIDIEVLTSGIDFTQSNTCPAQLAAGANCTVNVTFKPAIPGGRIGTLNITTTNGTIPHLVVLNGTGK